MVWGYWQAAPLCPSFPRPSRKGPHATLRTSCRSPASFPDGLGRPGFRRLPAAPPVPHPTPRRVWLGPGTPPRGPRSLQQGPRHSASALRSATGTRHWAAGQTRQRRSVPGPTSREPRHRAAPGEVSGPWPVQAATSIPDDATHPRLSPSPWSQLRCDSRSRAGQAAGSRGPQPHTHRGPCSSGSRRSWPRAWPRCQSCSSSGEGTGRTSASWLQTWRGPSRRRLGLLLVPGGRRAR